MIKIRHYGIDMATASVGGITASLLLWNGLWLIAGLVTLLVAAFLGRRLLPRKWRKRKSGKRGGDASAEKQGGTRKGNTSKSERASDDKSKSSAPRRTGKPVGDTGTLVEEMLTQGRYSLLLRPQIVTNLSGDQLQRALAALDANMAVVPEGDVLLQTRHAELAPGQSTELAGDRVVRVEGFYLDRYPVTNAQYYEFVAGGGYEQMSLWDPEILPALLDFVDRTGHPGPRFWEYGAFEPRHHDSPVIGISWYEASAYARWAGKRLPTDAEWVKSGSWPVVTDDRVLQRRFPWGDTMDRSRANLWGSGPERVVSVHEFSSGVSVGGIYQLIGNVWEWTHSNFRAWDDAGGRLELAGPMKSLRGGAYDTYFDNQASCHFQSGDSSIARKHNIGFRCGLGVCDLAEFLQGAGTDEDADTEIEPSHEAERSLDDAVLEEAAP
jgi:iron(II)-dependent oxidoreductase